MEPEPEPEPARAFSVADTPTGQTGFAVLIIDASAGEEEESLLFQYQNEAMQWDVSRVRGQLEALLSITGDALSQPATVADLRLKTARGGEDLVKAAFRTVKMAKGEAIVVFLYQVNVVRGEIARPTMQVLAAAQLMSDDELREAMPADLFPGRWQTRTRCCSARWGRTRTATCRTCGRTRRSRSTPPAPSTRTTAR